MPTMTDGESPFDPKSTLVSVAVEHLAAEPLVFLCAPDDECHDCDTARKRVESR